MRRPETIRAGWSPPAMRGATSRSRRRRSASAGSSCRNARSLRRFGFPGPRSSSHAAVGCAESNRACAGAETYREDPRAAPARHRPATKHRAAVRVQGAAGRQPRGGVLLRGRPAPESTAPDRRARHPSPVQRSSRPAQNSRRRVPRLCRSEGRSASSARGRIRGPVLECLAAARSRPIAPRRDLRTRHRDRHRWSLRRGRLFRRRPRGIARHDARAQPPSAPAALPRGACCPRCR